MGLAERRVTQEFQTNELPGLQKQINEAAGFTFPVEVRWEQLTPDGESHLYAESWKGIYFEPLIAALKSIARDEMGRDALKAVKGVVIQNTAGIANEDHWASFAEGTITLDHDPITNVYAAEQRAARLIQVLESNL
jgi:hypothetical protein